MKRRIDTPLTYSKKIVRDAKKNQKNARRRLRDVGNRASPSIL